MPDIFTLLDPYLFLFLRIIGFFIILLLAVAYLTLLERKVIAFMQKRVGPQVVGPFGLLQPIADGIKLIHKETIWPKTADKFLFLLAPFLVFTLSLTGFAIIPFDKDVVFSSMNMGVLFVLTLSSLSVYGIILAGWASHSKYAFLGALRSAAQMISYEVSMGIILVCVVMCSGSLNLSAIVMAQHNMWYMFKLFPLFIIFFISGLAETNRAPFDLPEAEAELVAGYHVEYASFPFALFFLGEYANMIFMSALCTTLFAGGFLPIGFLSINLPGWVWFVMKVYLFLFLFIWCRATFPRYRYDQLMRLGWRIFLPLSLVGFVIVAFCKLL